MNNDKTIIKINASKSQANQWQKKAKALGIPRADYLGLLLVSKETFPADRANRSSKKRISSL